MAERDPFGRLPDENPLEFLGRPSNGTESAAAEAVAAEAVAAEAATWARAGAASEQPASADPAKRTARVSSPEPKPLRKADHVQTRTTTIEPQQVARIARGVVRSVVLVAVLLVVVGGVGLVSFSGGSGSEKTTVVRLGAPDQAAPEPGSEPTRPNAAPPPAARTNVTPRGLNASSLLTRRNLAPALRRLGRSGLGRLRTLSIRPERVDAQLLTRGGRLRSVQLRSDGKLSDFGTSGPGFGGLDTIAFARVTPAAPERLVRGAAERLHRPASQVDYVVLLQLGSALTWSVFMRDGTHFQADAGGRITRRVG